MPTVVTKTIGTAGGRDYSTLATWIAACPADLVTADQVYRGEAYNDSEFVVAAQQTIGSGVTTDATRYIELTAAAGQSFVDHPNVRTNPLRYDQSKGVGVRCSTGYVTLFSVMARYTRFSRLQCKTHGVGGSQTLLATLGAPSGISNATIDSCVFDTLGSFWYALDLGAGDTLTNCLVRHAKAGGAGAVRTSTSGAVVNCLIVAPADLATKPNAGILRSYSSAQIVKNCGIFGFVNTVSDPTGITFTNCYTDVASPPAGCTTVAYDTSTGSGFFAATLAYHDFRLKHTSALIGAGTNSGAPLTDITGVTRPMGTTVDVGPWEVVPSNAVFDDVVFDAGVAGGYYNIGSSQTVSWSHTVGAGSNRALVVMAACANSGSVFSAATCAYGGVSMGAPVMAPSDTGVNITVAIWILPTPAVGTANIVIDIGAPTPFLTVDYVSSSWFYVDQASPVLYPLRHQRSFQVSPRSFSIPYVSGGMVVDLLSDRAVGQTLTLGATQTRIGAQIDGAGSTTSSGSYKAGPAMSWTFTNSGSATLAYGAVCLKPSFTLGTKHHPNGDIGQPQWMANPANWRRWEALDEAAASDSDYVFASVGSAPYVAEIGPLAAGTYTTRVRASVASGTGTLTIRLLDASLAVLATSAPQTVTTTPTTFTPDLTFASGTAYYISAEITA